ncbi:MAG TPA: homoserine O-acetyltransferase, partial [Acidimicrobiales bacterium]|nr:homoserine O-acetyltransferase [Acidimicrobiales bacterium]
MSAASARPAATGGVWWPGDDPGQRQFVTLFADESLKLEGNDSIGPITVAYETWGRPSPTRDNAVLVEHALTGDSHAAGPAGVGHGTP